MVLVAFAVLGCGAMPAGSGRVLSFDTLVHVGDTPLKVTVFNTAAERELGLMFVDKLPEGTGGLFIFEKEKRVRFWMKNTRFPMGILFFNSQGNMVHKIDSIQPCVGGECPTLSVDGVRYVVEVANKSALGVGLTLKGRLQLPRSW